MNGFYLRAPDYRREQSYRDEIQAEEDLHKERISRPRVTIEHGIPTPARFEAHWKIILDSMKPGDSFVVQESAHRKQVLRCSQHWGIEVTTAKLNGTGFRIWKL